MADALRSASVPAPLLPPRDVPGVFQRRDAECRPAAAEGVHPGVVARGRRQGALGARKQRLQDGSAGSATAPRLPCLTTS